ncbi:malate synthase A [Enemella evansiae]|uniref:malate synthase A n=1 Tax=Enemella evansiae TaxID=2016499 RepID=UPI000B972B62|nr:malate synthase A [Enemella evansiae]OYO18289.1 malate synthase A [Enemella evansiae]
MQQIEIVATEVVDRADEVLTPEALEFVAVLHRLAGGRRNELLAERSVRSAAIQAGHDPIRPAETAHLRADPHWQVAPPAPGLADRRVEIVGPTEPKQAINALNSGARVWLADLEDATSPTWRNVISGQVTLRDAVRGELEHDTAERHYRVTAEVTPTIVLRPRGWHLTESHLLVDGEPVSAALVDFGLYFFHNARELIARGRGPYFYLAKLESHQEARLWNAVFNTAQDLLGIPRGTIRATVLIETITAAVEMEEILYELREHAAGLSAGRWDYLFSLVKQFRSRGQAYLLPDRDQITMAAPFLREYTSELVRVCHRRGAYAIGGPAAFVPNRQNPAADRRALDRVRIDHTREAKDGFDGSWVAHPDLVPVCAAVFDETLGSGEHQQARRRRDRPADTAALIDVRVPDADISERGVRTNIRVGLRYLDAWLRGRGAVAIGSMMEDAATAEICRSQLWQWRHLGARTAEGQPISAEWLTELIAQEYALIPREAEDRLDEARELFAEVVLAERYPEFLTLAAYPHLLAGKPARLAPAA